MRVLIVTQGSTGDIYPLIALSRRLMAEGHTATLATSPHFHADIEAAGVGFLPLPPDWSQAEFTEAMKGLDRIKDALGQLRQIYRNAKPYLVENVRLIETAARDADVLVASYLLPYLQEVASRAGIPFAVTTFCHNVVPSVDYPPDNLPTLTWLPKPVQRLWNRFSWFAADRVLGATINNTIREELAVCQVGEVKRFCTHPADLALVTVSPGLMRPDATIDPRFVFCGYLRHQPEHSPALEAELKAFCQGDTVPVLTFGSVVADDSHEQFERFLASWPKGRKLMVQSGWAAFTAPAGRAEIKKLGKASHDQLFRYASLVIHHGGAGTTASALHAGVPQLVVPHIADQDFWARQVLRLGVGCRLPARDWGRQLTGMISTMAKNPSHKREAEAGARTLAMEDGAGAAVNALLRLTTSRTLPAAENTKVRRNP